MFHLLTLFLNSFSLLIERQSSCHLLQKEDDPLIPAGQLDHTLLDAILSTAEGCIGHRQNPVHFPLTSKVDILINIGEHRHVQLAEIWLMLMLMLICCERKTLFFR